jgi:perosamine synthetase
LIPVNRPLLTQEDHDHVMHSLRETWISGEAPPVAEMESTLCKVLDSRFAIAFSSGTTAIDIAVEALDIKPGDECILPTFTIISSASNILRKGGKLLLVDSDQLTWSMDAVSTAEAINDKTKVVMPVHIYGLSVDMDPILEAAERFNTFVLEDAAEALGVKYKDQNCGTIGSAGIYSFYANKTVTGGEGGAVVTDDEEFATRLRYLRNLCFNPNERFVHEELGWNGRISALSASLIASQLSRLPSLIARKIQIGKRYRQGLEGHPYFTFQPEEIPSSKNAYWVFGILIKKGERFNAKSLQLKLRELQVDTRRFFCPLHLQPLASRFEIETVGNLTNSEYLWEMGLYLPSGIGTTDLEIDQVVEILWSLVEK